jgi:sulfur carrier protein ThiS
MRVKILKLGSATREADLPAGSTVSDALAKVDLESAGYSLCVNGMGAGLGTSLADHDIVTLVPKVEGGLL